MRGQTARSLRLFPPRDPDLLARPLPRPLGRDELVARGRIRRRLQLVQRLDLEAVLSQHAQHLAVGEVELDRVAVLVVPLDAAEAELRPHQPVGRDQRARRGAHEQQRGVGEEDEPPARPQQPRGLGDPALRLAPQAGAVLGEGEVEARVGERDRLGVALDERELEAVLGLHGTCGGELLGRLVNADRPRAAAGKPGGEVGGAAAELDGVEPVHVRERADVGLGDLPDAPVGLLCGPVAARGLGVAGRLVGPVAAVDLLVAHPASARPCAKPAASASGTRLRSIRLWPIASAAPWSGRSVRTRAPRARSASDSASAAAFETELSGRDAAVGLRHRTSIPRRAGVASRFVGLHTPPSTYSRPSIVTGLNTHGIEHDASTACATLAPGEPGAPNTTRLPLRRSTAAMRSRPSKLAPDCSISRASPPSERLPRGTAASAAARATAPPGAVPASASGAKGAAAVMPIRPTAEASGPRSSGAPAGIPPGAPLASPALEPHSLAARASGPESGSRPAARNAATIEPADVPTKYSQSRKSMPVARPAPSSSPRIHASPSVPPAARTRTSGRWVSGSAIALSLRTHECHLAVA